MTNANPGRRPTPRLFLAGLCLALSLPVLAQTGQSLEERLRAELRNNRQELQMLRSQQAQWEARAARAEAERRAAEEKLAAMQAHLSDSEKKLAAQRRASAGRLAESRERNQQVRDAYDQLLGMARDKEVERRQLARRVTEQAQALETCAARNGELYRAGREILDAYESLGAGGLFKLRQPLAASARVEFEEGAQAYGDRLYNNQVDAVVPDAESKPTPDGDQ
ncbi:MAG: DNA repair protein [Alcanivorax sp.]|uniref:DNA repair protein n=1 Tax=Alloalcanivorax marinus TaxID=1177169 RepID=UPI00195AC72C|nr:DNA repair protein [Alloalcanivorax marinus]MBM7333298.1 DNA repair protein [Alloalcanivorax marinus]